MSKRIKVGDVYLDLAEDKSSRPICVIAEKGEMSSSIEPVAFSNPGPDLISLYIAGAASKDRDKRTNEPADAGLDRMTAWQTFAGARSGCPPLWLRYAEGEARHCGFNKWAFLFGLQWFLFNKMFVHVLVVAVAEVGGAILGISAMLRVAGAMHDPRAVLLIQWLCLAAGFGIPRHAVAYWANVSLFRKAQKEIAKINTFDVDNARKLSMIASAGAGSLGLVFALYVLVFVVRLVSTS